MAQIMQLLPEVSGEELVFVQNLIKDKTDDQAQQFAMAYRARRKNPQIILLTTLLAFVGLGGVNRFLLGQTGMGVLYLLTGGVCLIGSILDLVNFQAMALTYNQQQAQQVVSMIGS